MSPERFSPDPLDAAKLTQNDAFYRECLHGLLEVGAALAANLPNQAKAAAYIEAKSAEPPSFDAMAAFERVARAMRLTILLARSLAEPPPVPRSHRQSTAATPNLAGTAQASPPEHAERAEQPERAERPEIVERVEDIAGRSPADVIAEVTRDLGIPNPWQPRPAADLPTRTAGSVAPARPRAEYVGADPSTPRRPNRPARPPDG